MRGWVLVVLAGWLAPLGAVRAEGMAATRGVGPAPLVRLLAKGAPTMKGDGVTFLDHWKQPGATMAIGLVAGAGLAAALRRRARAALPGAERGTQADPREERIRLAALTAGPPLALLAAPAVLGTVGWHASLFASGVGTESYNSGFFGSGYNVASPHPMELGSAIFAFGWPLLLAAQASRTAASIAPRASLRASPSLPHGCLGPRQCSTCS